MRWNINCGDIRLGEPTDTNKFYRSSIYGGRRRGGGGGREEGFLKL